MLIIQKKCFETKMQYFSYIQDGDKFSLSISCPVSNVWDARLECDRS